ncbi:LLM class flavin-dependent oxidoreductase [Kibdelosporangium aridum]|uniref:Luciferase family oxidoreductase, group 1 n=1 Tax=Kibdelosporangium aridum TaxID=2030 RepID=A0A1W2FG67_KIBAR|nr:LLM class flavin-dependent oxidoreductase [Kibdelosporangium aridum]SMD20744.1 luciferase family oxidoreductase, group 1 [Kibdelosporangium aridum]
MRLSVLDTAPVWQGSTPAQSLRDTVDLAKHVERFGYRRFWVAEHHLTPSIASTSPAVLVGQIASATSTIRVGSGGVLLPNHPPLIVAEQFGTLAALHPDRIDLGIGRAPGSDPGTVRLLRRSEAGFPAQLAELRGYFANEMIPAAAPVWLLGSSASSARLAGELGLPYAFAHHFNPADTLPAVAAYRESFQPSAALAQPYVLVCALMIAADTDERAQFLASSLALMIVRMSAGGLNHGRHVPPEIAVNQSYTDAERQLVKDRMAPRIIGGPDTVRRGISSLLASTGADELMVITLIHDQAERIRCYELIADLTSSGLEVADSPM